MMNDPLHHDRIVIAIPVYNEERFIAETLASVAAQEWQDFAVLISDNASTDRTGEICRDLAAADPRFHYIRQRENRGSAENFNYALDMTAGPLVMCLGGHDTIAPDFLKEHLRAMAEKPSCSLSYSLTQWTDENGTPVRVTNPSRLNLIVGTPLARYMKSVRRIGEATAINNVIRRSALGASRFSKIASSDHVVLSELLFGGPANLVDRPLYIRREVDRRPDYMERLTGEAGVERDVMALFDIYRRSHSRLPLAPIVKRLTRPLLNSLLRERFADCYGFSDKVNFRLMRWLDLR
jgi:O-antigen biosynthesis protein